MRCAAIRSQSLLIETFKHLFLYSVLLELILTFHTLPRATMMSPDGMTI